MPDQTDADDPAAKTEGLEKIDVEAAKAAAQHRHHPMVRTLGTVSELADQMQLTTVCGAVIAGGIFGGRADIARTGLRMMAAHVLANVVKRRIKNRLRRTRPEKMVDEQDYHFEPGEAEGGHETSFPSGHTAGAVAVARIVARDMPALTLPVTAFAAMIATVQVPRAKHYPIDVAAGAALGLAAAWAVDRLLPGTRHDSQAKENRMSDNATKSVSALFETREAADYAIEHLVQQHGLNRADIFAEPEGPGNTAGNRPSGGDANKGDGAEGAALRGGIKVSVDVASDRVETVEGTFREMGGQDIARR
ncbi:phosphatase PAP2 family protein [Paracoccus sp. (in: a-proteobacteria)]|uniref:phosphatase PAP2 family protein n=1 Tax=Paracoccus sp. TaxID=267 RepID=UPI0035AF17D1